MAVSTIGDTSIRLQVTGMTCGGCASQVQRSLEKVPGVTGASVNLALEQADVTISGGADSIVRLADDVRRSGFGIVESHVRLEIVGMTCASCASRVERALMALPGVIEVSANPTTDLAEVRVLRGNVEPAALLAAVRASGYEARLHASADHDGGSDPASESNGRERLELIAAIFLTLPLVGQMAVMVVGTGWHLPVWVELALATPVQFWLARRFYLAAWHGLKAGAGNMDQLVVLGTGAAYLYSLWLVADQGVNAGGKLYFEASAVIVTLILLGKYLENRAKRSASSALRELMALQPDRALALRGGKEVELPIAEVMLGDILLVKPGARVPVDGVVVRGQSEIDESLITGESLPVLRQSGDAVVAGAVNGTGLLRLRAERIGEDTTLARISELVNRAQAGKAPIQRLVDKVSAIFVPVVLVLAALTLVVWLATGQAFALAWVAAISVLVIACPCALGLATPTALVAGTGAAARHGILIKDIQTLELAHRLDTVIFDKTGTLTEGRPQVSDILPIGVEPAELLALAASAQAASEHPLARGIVEAAKAQGLELQALEDFKAYPGEGVEARLAGTAIRVGRLAFAVGDVVRDTREQFERLEAKGRTVVAVSRDGGLLGWIALADRLRGDARRAVVELQSQGIAVWLLSGDNAATVKRIADELGIQNVEAEVRPADKAARIRELVDVGRCVAMVGDGVNDAPALAAASVGIAMGGGAAVAAEAAGITLMRPMPSLVSGTIDIAQATSVKIRQNLFWAFVYNVIGLPIAAFGLLNPAVAGAAMALSSVSVVSNSLLLKRWRPASRGTSIGDKVVGGAA